MGRRDYKNLEGKYIRIEFWDHCYGNIDKIQDDMFCELVGKVVQVSERSIVLGSWTQITKDIGGKDEDGYRVLKCCIEKIKVLK